MNHRHMILSKIQSYPRLLFCPEQKLWLTNLYNLDNFNRAEQYDHQIMDKFYFYNLLKNPCPGRTSNKSWRKKKKKNIHMRFPIKLCRLRKARFFQKLSIKWIFFYQILMLIVKLKCQDSVAAKQKIIDLAFACGCSNVAGYKSELIFMLLWICISSSRFQALRAKLGILTVLTVMIWNRLH